MKNENIKAKIQELENQIQELKLQVENETSKVKIEVGDFAFYSGHAYMIIENHDNTFHGNKFVGIRFNFNNTGRNEISWIGLISASGFSKFGFGKTHEIHKPEDCDLSAFGYDHV